MMHVFVSRDWSMMTFLCFPTIACHVHVGHCLLTARSMSRVRRWDSFLISMSVLLRYVSCNASMSCSVFYVL